MLIAYLFNSYKSYDDAVSAGKQLAEESDVGYKVLPLTSKEYPWGLYLDKKIAKRTCRYHEKTELDESGECPKCLDEIINYGKVRATGKIPVGSPLLRRAMVNSGQGGWFRDYQRHSEAARKGADKRRLGTISALKRIKLERKATNADAQRRDSNLNISKFQFPNSQNSQNRDMNSSSTQANRKRSR